MGLKPPLVSGFVTTSPDRRGKETPATGLGTLPHPWGEGDAAKRRR